MMDDEPLDAKELEGFKHWGACLRSSLNFLGNVLGTYDASDRLLSAEEIKLGFAADTMTDDAWADLLGKIPRVLRSAEERGILPDSFPAASRIVSLMVGAREVLMDNADLLGSPA